MADDGLRRSMRKRNAPSRFGFQTGPNQSKRRKTAAAASDDDGSHKLSLKALPEDLLQRILCEDLCAVSEHFALHTTSKQFHRLSSSADRRKNLKFFNGPNGTKHPVTAKELLPYATEGNLDAIFLLGLIATYVEDDLETGLSLFERGAQDGCNRARHELGLILQRVRVRVDGRDLEPNQQSLEAGQALIDTAAAAEHAPSEIEKIFRTNPRQPWSDKKEMVIAEEDARVLLLPLINEKPDPPRPKWAWESCTRPSCIRGSYVLKRRCREWLKSKPFSSTWQACRRQVLDCGIPSQYYCPDSLFCLPTMSCCGGCVGRNTTYCSQVCQHLDWGRHKQECAQMHRQAHQIFIQINPRRG